MTVTPDEAERAWKVCELVATGKTLRQIDADGPPMRSSEFLAWVQKWPELARLYQTALEISAFVLEDFALSKAMELVERKSFPPGMVPAYKTLLEHVRWVVGKRNPRVFAERAAVSVTVPIQIVTPLDMGEGRVGGTKEFPNIYELKADVVQDIPIEEMTDDQIDAVADRAAKDFEGARSALTAQAGSKEPGQSPSRAYEGAEEKADAGANPLNPAAFEAQTGSRSKAQGPRARAGKTKARSHSRGPGTLRTGQGKRTAPVGTKVAEDERGAS